MMTTLTQAAYAKHRRALGLRGKTARSVRRALEVGRIHAELGGGIDPARADAEWAGSTRLRVDVGGAKGRASSALSSMTLRERTARAKTLELELARKTGEVVSRRDVELGWSHLVVEARTALLGLPSRFKARLPHLSSTDLAVIDSLIRECLEGLADNAALRSRNPKET